MIVDMLTKRIRKILLLGLIPFITYGTLWIKVFSIWLETKPENRSQNWVSPNMGLLGFSIICGVAVYILVMNSIGLAKEQEAEKLKKYLANLFFYYLFVSILFPPAYLISIPIAIYIHRTRKLTIDKYKEQ